jgi:SAM-dependent methyltransferase
MRPGAVKNPDRLRAQVRARYAEIASRASFSPPANGCCEPSAAIQIGYDPHELATLPAGANLSLGCGSPTSLVSLRPGEVVVDLGSGAGIDCFLAAKRVGPRGRVIGVDMTPEILAKARALARSSRYRNVEFRLGEIEHLPVADRSADVVLSNCVINLAPDQDAVYREAYRVLRPGGRLAVSDVVATRKIAAKERDDPALWTSCSSGAMEIPRLTTLLRRVGFTEIDIDVTSRTQPVDSLREQASLGVVAAAIRATKRRTRTG